MTYLICISSTVNPGGFISPINRDMKKALCFQNGSFAYDRAVKSLFNHLDVDYPDVEPGMKGVVYERYDRSNFDDDPEDNVGVGIIFETGSYDGFSRSDLAMYKIENTGVVDEFASYYRFENVGQLDQDFKRSYFDLALGKRERPEPGKPRQNISLTNDDFKTLVSGGELVDQATVDKGI